MYNKFKILHAGLFTILILCESCKSNSMIPMNINNVKLDKSVKVLIVQPSSPSLPHDSRQGCEISAVQIRYEFAKPNPGGMSSLLKTVPTLLIRDSYEKKLYFIDPEHSFYMSNGSGMKGYTVAGGFIIMSDSYLELPDSVSNDSAIAEFQRIFTAQKFDLEWQKRATNIIGLGRAVPRRFFADGPLTGASFPYPVLESVQMKDNILRLGVRNPATKIPAIFWIDITARKVIKSIVDGKEMNLDSVDPYYKSAPASSK